MYQLFPSYDSFVLFSVILAAIGVLSIIFRPQLNAIEDTIRDSIELTIKRKKSHSKAGKHQTPKHHQKSDLTSLRAEKRNNFAA